MRTKAAVSCVLMIALGLVACGEHRKPPKKDIPGLDRKLSTFAFIEEGDLVTFIVGTRAARYRADAGYFPIEISVATRGVKQLSLTRESFTLKDDQGNSYACVEPKELIEKYEFLDLDRRLAELYDIVFNRFATFTEYRSKFSPTRTAPSNPLALTVVQDTVTVPKFGFIIDFIYFPVPKGGLMDRKLELFMQAPELQDPVFVKFAVR